MGGRGRIGGCVLLRAVLVEHLVRLPMDIVSKTDQSHAWMLFFVSDSMARFLLDAMPSAVGRLLFLLPSVAVSDSSNPANATNSSSRLPNPLVSAAFRPATPAISFSNRPLNPFFRLFFARAPLSSRRSDPARPALSRCACCNSKSLNLHLVASFSFRSFRNCDLSCSIVGSSSCWSSGGERDAGLYRSESW